LQSIFERLKKSIQSNTKKKKGSDERQKKTQTAAEGWLELEFIILNDKHCFDLHSQKMLNM